jgi:hypothetical protein
MMISDRIFLILIATVAIKLQRGTFWLARMHAVKGQKYITPHYSSSWTFGMIILYGSTSSRVSIR